MPLPNVLFVFPGQGAQYVGMGTDLIEEFTAARQVYEQASDVVKYDMIELSSRDPRGELNLTRFTQPALLTHEFACLEALRTIVGDARPALAAGHSLGEYTALVAAGVLAFEDALRLVAKRGELMGTLGRGGMVATTLDADAAASLAARHFCGIAGCNLPDQTVIAGDDADLEALVEDLPKRFPGKRAIRLNTEGAFHTFLMVEAALEFRAVLEATPFAAPDIGVLSNYTGQLHDADAPSIRSRLFFQLFNPVRWFACVNTALDAGIETIIELGGGIGKGEGPAEKRPNLEGLIKKSLKSRDQQAHYLPAVNSAGVRAAGQQLTGA